MDEIYLPVFELQGAEPFRLDPVLKLSNAPLSPHHGASKQVSYLRWWITNRTSDGMIR